jgi:aerobic carbon-monoxide dehydrogenase large subunit
MSRGGPFARRYAKLPTALANVVGQRIRRREDPRFLRGEGRYVDDLSLPGALHLTFVRSYMAHAKVTGVDKSGAQDAGAQVFVAGDTDLTVNPAPPFIRIDAQMYRPLLASDTVRFVGDIVAIVLADSREASVDAAELVEVDYEPLPAVTDPVQAARDEVLLFPGVGTNICLRNAPEAPDPNLFDSSEVVVTGTVISQRLAACPIEPRSSAAHWGEDGRLTLWISSQTPHQDKMVLGALLGLEPENVRVVAPDVGGGFGAKGIAVEDVLVGWLARATGKPVRWTETRSENMVAMHHGRASNLTFELGASRDGKIEALRLNILADAGAYPGIGSFLPTLTSMMASGVYVIPKIEIHVRAVVTNTTPIGPVRGAGRPEATQMLERAIDTLAAELSLDPAEVRRRNFIPNDAFPYTTASGANYDIGDFGGALDLALESAGYDNLRREQASRRENGDARQLGIGLSAYVEVTNGISESEFGGVEITATGEAIVRTGSFSQGQGHETTFAQIVSERLGIPIEKITVTKGDTDVVPRGTGTYGSKSTQIGGVAAGQASEEVVETGKRLAAAELEAAPEDMVLDVEQGRFHVTGAPEPALSWGDLAARLDSQGQLGELSAEVDFQAAQPTFPFGAHVAVVEVDTETGAVELQRMVAVDDAGRIINPLVAEGQVHGGVAAGIAQALYEELTYDSDGNPQNANLVTYGIPAATELPAIEVVGMETPTPINPLGVKGIGESGTIGATPAVHNAVIDALAPYGVRHIDMPVNGETVWRAIQAAGNGA